jgi:alcohol dehydrogenase (cytochrome c)
MGGNLYALDTATGQKLWGKKIDGAMGGGVITYSAGGAQRIAVAVGLTLILWPTEMATAIVRIGSMTSATIVRWLRLPKKIKSG